MVRTHRQNECRMILNGKYDGGGKVGRPKLRWLDDTEIDLRRN